MNNEHPRITIQEIFFLIIFTLRTLYKYSEIHRLDHKILKYILLFTKVNKTKKIFVGKTTSTGTY